MPNKELPVATGVADYFNLALLAVANLSFVANEQHSPGQPMHWARHKSRDHRDCMMRHALYGNTLDSDGKPHSVKVSWRGLANLQESIEQAIVADNREFLYGCGFDDELIEAWRPYAIRMQRLAEKTSPTIDAEARERHEPTSESSKTSDAGEAILGGSAAKFGSCADVAIPELDSLPDDPDFSRLNQPESVSLGSLGPGTYRLELRPGGFRIFETEDYRAPDWTVIDMESDVHEEKP